MDFLTQNLLVLIFFLHSKKTCYMLCYSIEQPQGSHYFFFFFLCMKKYLSEKKKSVRCKLNTNKSKLFFFTFFLWSIALPQVKLMSDKNEPGSDQNDLFNTFNVDTWKLVEIFYIVQGHSYNIKSIKTLTLVFWPRIHTTNLKLVTDIQSCLLLVLMSVVS